MSKRAGYADPPYMGQSEKHYAGHPDYAGEVDQVDLLKRLDDEFDGWVLHCSSPSLPFILCRAEELGITGYRVMAWVKPFAAFKRNVPVAYAWEPVLVKPCRKPVVRQDIVKPLRDWLAESITLKRGLTGAKPEKVCHWLFVALGLTADDELVDLFPGSGAVGRAWKSFQFIDRNSRAPLSDDFPSPPGSSPTVKAIKAFITGHSPSPSPQPEERPGRICSACNGTGGDPSFPRMCRKCKGSGQLPPQPEETP